MKWEDFLSLSGNSHGARKVQYNRQKIFCALPPPLFNITNILSDLLLFFISHHWPLHSKMPKEIFKKKKSLISCNIRETEHLSCTYFFSTNHPVCLLPVWAIIPRSSLLSSFHCCNPRPFSQERRKEIKEGKRRVAALQLFFPLSRLSSLAAAALKSWKGKRVVLEDLLFRCCHEDRRRGRKKKSGKKLATRKKTSGKENATINHQMVAFRKKNWLPSSRFPSVSARQSKEKRRAFPRKKNLHKNRVIIKNRSGEATPFYSFSLFFRTQVFITFSPSFLSSCSVSRKKSRKKIFIPLLHRSRRLFIFLYASGDAPPERRRRQQGIHKEKPWASSSPCC